MGWTGSLLLQPKKKRHGGVLQGETWSFSEFSESTLVPMRHLLMVSHSTDVLRMSDMSFVLRRAARSSSSSRVESSLPRPGLGGGAGTGLPKADGRWRAEGWRMAGDQVPKDPKVSLK